MLGMQFLRVRYSEDVEMSVILHNRTLKEYRQYVLLVNEISVNGVQEEGLRIYLLRPGTCVPKIGWDRTIEKMCFFVTETVKLISGDNGKENNNFFRTEKQIKQEGKRNRGIWTEIG